MNGTAPDDFQITALGSVGVGLDRPECVLATSTGLIYSSDARGGIVRIDPSGNQTFLGEPDPHQSRFRPNGIALQADNSLLFANLGEDGGIWQINGESPSTITPFLLEIDAQPIGAVNFVLVAPDESVWFSVLSGAGHHAPLSASRADGYIARSHKGNTQIMADQLVSANEFRIDAQLNRLYVNETFAQRTTAFDINADGALSNRRVLARYGAGTYPDGLTLDAEGGLWITSIVSNRILRVSAQGDQQTVYDESDPERIAAAATALADGTLGRELIYANDGARLQNPTSIAFGGADLRTAYVGSLNGQTIRSFASPVAGMAMAHWTNKTNETC